MTVAAVFEETYMMIYLTMFGIYEKCINHGCCLYMMFIYDDIIATAQGKRE